MLSKRRFANRPFFAGAPGKIPAAGHAWSVPVTTAPGYNKTALFVVQGPASPQLFFSHLIAAAGFFRTPSVSDPVRLHFVDPGIALTGSAGSALPPSLFSPLPVRCC